MYSLARDLSDTYMVHMHSPSGAHWAHACISGKSLMAVLQLIHSICTLLADLHSNISLLLIFLIPLSHLFVRLAKAESSVIHFVCLLLSFVTLFFLGFFTKK